MNWTRGQPIGRGSSATIFAAKFRNSGEIFAVKSAEFFNSEFLQREQRILSTLNSPWIVGYKGYDVTRENNMVMFNLMLEYMTGGTILDGIRLNGGRIGESTIGFYAKQIVGGLEYLHSRGIVHCDIKSSNVLLCESGAKIADFGCAKWLGGDRKFAAGAISGTPMFMSPEAAQGKEQSFPADIWALGCTVIEMATGGLPWPDATDPASILYKIAYSGESPEIPSFLSDQAKDFLQKCLKRNPDDRWTAEQLQNHQFLQESNFTRKQSQELETTSPTSILDQGIWNSINGEDSIRTPRSLHSPTQRVKKLCFDSPEFPEWEVDEDCWTTVRSGEKTGVNCGSVAAALSSNGVAAETCHFFIGDNLLLLLNNYTVDDNVSCSSSSCSTGTDQVVVISKNLDFERREDMSVKQLQFL